jgi:hypothetical protein
MFKREHSRQNDLGLSRRHEGYLSLLRCCEVFRLVALSEFQGVLLTKISKGQAKTEEFKDIDRFVRQR